MSNRLNLLCIILLTTIGCQVSSNHSEIQVGVGARPFQFNPRAVSEITLSKSDPETGDRWFTILKKHPKGWEISSGPQDQPILDNFADDTFIFHLIDNLQSVQVTSVAPRGSLESFDLNPPRFALKWKTPEKDYVIQVGGRLKDLSGYYFTTTGDQVYIARGSSLKLLEMIQSFPFIRKRTWTHLSPDSVDEIEIFHQGKPVLYAQRDGDTWADRNHKMIKRDLDSFLNGSVLAQTKSFIDDEKEAIKLKKLLHQKAQFEAKLSDRFGQVTHIKIISKDKTVYGFNTSRPSSVFVMDTNLLNNFKKVTHL